MSDCFCVPPTAATVDLFQPNNATWLDAFQFGTPGDTSWNFVGQNFIMEVKGGADVPTALLTLQTSDGTIVVDDTVNRILHFNVPDATIQADLPPGCYVYDLVMFDNSVPPVRTVLMAGRVRITQGVTV